MKIFFAFFKRNGIHHAFALNAFKTGFQNFPFGGIQHDRHFGYVRLGGNQHQKAHHRFFGLQHAFIHVDVDDLRAIFYLLLGNVQSGFKITFNNQPFGTRAEPVTLVRSPTLTKSESGPMVMGSRPDNRHCFSIFGICAAGILHGFDNGFNVRGRCAATTADNIQIAASRPIRQFFSHRFGCFIVFTEFIRQARIRVGGYMRIGNASIIHLCIDVILSRLMHS